MIALALEVAANDRNAITLMQARARYATATARSVLCDRSNERFEFIRRVSCE